jgi:hypothetical protein
VEARRRACDVARAEPGDSWLVDEKVSTGCIHGPQHDGTARCWPWKWTEGAGRRRGGGSPVSRRRGGGGLPVADNRRWSGQNATAGRGDGGALYTCAHGERVMGWLRRGVERMVALGQRARACVGVERSVGGQRQGLAWKRRRKGFCSYVGIGW